MKDLGRYLCQIFCGKDFLLSGELIETTASMDSLVSPLLRRPFREFSMSTGDSVFVINVDVSGIL